MIFVALILVVIVGFLPGSEEGIYRNRSMNCMCDSVNFFQLREGKVLSYASAHPPADLVGRYEIGDDGFVNIYINPPSAEKGESLFSRFKPRLLFTEFEKPDGNKNEWYLKLGASQEIERALKEHEIKSSVLRKDGTWENTYYDSSFRKLRVEVAESREFEKVEVEAVSRNHGRQR